MDPQDEDNSKEELAQYMYENKRLKDELLSLRRNSLSVEENLNKLSIDADKKGESLKRTERQVNSLLEAIKAKDEILVIMEHENSKFLEVNKKLESDLVALKLEKSSLEDQIKTWRIREKEIMIVQTKLEKERSEFKSTINSLEKNNTSNGALIDDLHQQIKILKDEKAQLLDKVELLSNKSFENSNPLLKNSESLSKDNLVAFSTVQEQLDVSFYIDGNKNLDPERCHFNLHEELLLAEIHEKENKIDELSKKHQFLSDREIILKQKISLLIDKLKEAVNLISRVWSNTNLDFELIWRPLRSNFENLIIELQNWSDGQTGEKNLLTEAPDLVEAKEAVINSQPIPNRTVESVSIATQTDRILLAKAFEEFSPLQNVLDHKYNDMDMDLYRSCRKLSILLEEEDDETLKRIPSIKNAVNSKSFSAKLPHSYKTQSADDIANFEKRINKNIPSEKLISSCSNIIFSTRDNKPEKLFPQNELCQGSPDPGKIASIEFPTVCDSKLSDANNYKAEQKSMNDSKKLQVATLLDPLEPLRQPHSFDSYLDPQQVSTPVLPRQISDPIQSSIFDPPLTRRGSYLRRPRSTCRPLRLPYENEAKSEERVSKVRFDLSNNMNSKLGDNINGSKGPMPISNLKNHRKIERISRFTVELVDEDEFRKSIDESDKMANRKRPPLIHSVVYKKSVFYDMTSYNQEGNFGSENGAAANVNDTGSPDSPAYETANENSPGDSFEMTNYESNYLIADIYPCKRRKQSDSSSYSIESQDSIDGSDIIVKSIRLHTNSEYITMKELDRESSTSSHLSVDLDIPYIDAEELPVIKPSPEIIKTSIVEANSENLNQDNEFAVPEVKSDDALISIGAQSLDVRSDSSDTFVTAYNDFTPTLEIQEAALQIPKSTGLSKSPTVLKNLANFELYNTVSESIAIINQNKRGNSSMQNNIVEEEEETSDFNEESECGSRMEDDRDEEEEESTILKLTSSDVSEISDTITYVTVKSDPSNLLLSSDYDSDTYVTIQSDKSTLERKFSDVSENSSSPYNTPPDTSSASFCTLPDTYSPILHAKQFTVIYKEEDSSRCHTRSSSPYRNLEQNDGTEQFPNSSFNTLLPYDTPPNLSPFNSPSCSSRFSKNNFALFSENSFTENESVTIYNIDDSNFPSEKDNSHQRKESIMFESPKLEFYETNDSKENLEAFLNTEEGLQELVRTSTVREESWKCSILEDLQEEPAFEDSEYRYLEIGEELQGEGLSVNNNLESPSSNAGDSKFFEKRNKRHPPLSRQNSTEDYNFLDPHDSCLNLSEEISSPSTTPDTSNKTVIFKNKPLTLSNTIDLEDDDFPISESEVQINFNGSETEIVDIPEGETSGPNKKNDIYSCRSEPCIPSISSSADMPAVSRLAKQSSSMTENSPSEVQSSNSDGNMLISPTPPEIIVSNLSSESESDSDNSGGNLIDFASNVSDRSEINFSDLNSLSGQSDNAYSNSEQSDNLISDRSPELQTSEPDESLSIFTEITDSSSSSSYVPSAVHSKTRTTDPPPHMIDTDILSHAEDIQQFYVEIPEQLTDSSVGNLRVVDLSDDITKLYAKYDLKASLVNVLLIVLCCKICFVNYVQSSHDLLIYF